MKAKRLSELKDLLAAGGFTAWWSEYQKSVSAEKDAQARYDELLTQSNLMDFRAELAQKNAIDTLYRAGELEDSAANMLAEAQELENRSLELVGNFEELRFKVSEIWYRLGGAERKLEEEKDGLAKAKAALEAAPGPQKAEHRTRLTHAEAALKHAEREHRVIHEEYERESQRKTRLWDEVERMWGRTFEISLVVAERKAEGKKIRKNAERLFKEAEERKERAKQLRAEAEDASRARDTADHRRTDLLGEARDKFGCVAGEGFLYWREKENQKSAYAVALIEDHEGYNLEVAPLHAYAVDRQRGVNFLEPARSGLVATDEEGDRRFERYFLEGRRKKPREGSAGA